VRLGTAEEGFVATSGLIRLKGERAELCLIDESGGCFWVGGVRRVGKCYQTENISHMETFK
jgi:hypothetical protein